LRVGYRGNCQAPDVRVCPVRQMGEGGHVTELRAQRGVARQWIAGLLALLVAGATTVVASTAATAVVEPAGLSIEKTGPSGDQLPLTPGEPFNYVITVQCSYSVPNSGCYDATITDTIPAPLELAGTPTVVSDGNSTDVTTTGNDVNIVFDTVFLNTTDPGSGMLGGTTATITIPVVVPADADYDYDGQPIVNEAEFSASNPDTPPETDDHEVAIDVPLVVDTDISKSFSPAAGTATEGAPTVISIDASNQSETGVDSMVITDPASGSSSTTFDYLQLDSITITDVPAGADEMTVYVDTGAGLEPVGAAIDVDPPAPPYVIDLSGVDLESVVGIQVEFTDTDGSHIDEGATAGIDVGVSQRNPGELTDDVTVENTAESEVSRDSVPATDTGDATYDITTNIPSVEAGKTFSPDQVVHGESSTATITAGVSDALDVDSLTVTEPSNTVFSDAMAFEGFVNPITFPEGADEATITYDAGGTFGPFEPGDDVPLPTDLDAVESFSITFQDTDDSGIVAGGTPASIPFTVGTDPDDTAEVTSLVNETTVTGTTTDGVNGTDTAEDTLHAFEEHVDSTTTKAISPSTITGWDNEWIVMQLTGGTAGSPVDGGTDDPYSSVPSQQIVISDPANPDPDNPDPFWEAFHPTQLVDISIPADASLTINYWDGDEWVYLVGPIDGATTYSVDIDDLPDPAPTPEEIGGLQFEYDYIGTGEGFAPGTSFQPNVVMNFDADAAGATLPTTFTNCTTASASGGAVDSGDAPPACADVDVLEPDAQPGPSMDKLFVDASGNEDPSIPARSHRVTRAQLHWSTGGASNVDSVTLMDEAGAPPTDVANSVFDTFDVTVINAIDSSVDPLIQYDAIDAVLIYRADLGDWVVPTESLCGPLDDGGGPEFTADCAGGMPEIVLSGVERANTIGVQIVYVENPDARGGALAPPVGSGVARSTDADDRTAQVTFRVRDWRRSSLPSLDAVDGLDVYNVAGSAGTVRNTASATSVIGDDSATVTDGAVIVITTPDLSVSTTKTWDGSPVGVPPQGTALLNYPHTGLELTVTNSSPIVYADELRITDRPTVGRPTADPTVLMPDVFSIASIDSVTMPGGASSATVTLYDDTGAVLLESTNTDASDALTWTAAAMTGAVGFEVTFLGRDGTSLGGPGNPTSSGIAPGETGGIGMTLRLRAEDRERGELINDDYLDAHGVLDPDSGQVRVPVENSSVGIVDDAGRDPSVYPTPPEDTAEAGVELAPFIIGVSVDKEFGPVDGGDLDDTYLETEPDREPFLMMLTVTPTDGARPSSMQVSDLDPSFWNAYEFVEVQDSFLLEDPPIDDVEMQVCVGPDLSGGSGGPIDGGCERFLNPLTNEALYNGDFVVAGDGTDPFALPTGVAAEDVIGLVFTFSSADAWDRPWNPVQEVPVIVQRRETMLTPLGVAPPTDLDGNLAAPGEASAGVWENTAQGAITALLGQDGTTDVPIHAVATDDTATVTFAHSVTAAEATKTPDGESPLSLAGPTTFTLTFTNTGDTPIYNPVFTDEIPSDADGTLLFVDPEPAQTGDSPYSYDLTESGSGLPAGWTALPEDPALVTVTPDPAPEGTAEIEFSFPDGYALGVGESYSIGIQMYPRAGLTPDAVIVNTAVIEGDRPFDYCGAGPFDPDGQQVLATCEGDATNSVAGGGALRSGKFVRAGTTDAPDYSLGTLNTVTPGDACVPYDGQFNDGFFALPCVPRTAPGQTETWRLVLRNTGNVPLSQIIAVDRLPDVGDGTALNPDFERGSQWAPVLTSPFAATGGNGGATLTVYVTEDVEPCTDVITHTGTCNGSWTLLEDWGGNPADLTGSMYIVDFAEGAELEPAGVVWVDVETTTPATAPELTDPATASADPIAWNTVATSATTDDGTDLLATEGNAAGVALATGAIEFTKELSGDGAAQYAPDEFEITVVCTSLGEEVYRNTFDVDVTVDPSVLVDNLPYEAECTVEEGESGQYTVDVDPESVIVPDGAVAPATITITNDYPLASLRLTKQVVGDGGGSSVDPEDAGPFAIAALCSYLGEFVLATNTGDFDSPPAFPNLMVVELGHLDSEVLTGLPAGAECVVGELDPLDATGVGITWDAGGVTGTNVFDAAETPLVSDAFALVPDDPQGLEPPGTENDALVVNQYAEGSLELIKELDGPAADEHGGDTFTVDVYCTYQPTQPAGAALIVSYDASVDLTPGVPVSIDGILVGSECTITESESNGADQWIFDPAADPANPDQGFVVVDSDTVAVDVSVTNRFEDLVDLDVTKIVNDDPLNDGQGGVPDVGPFPVTVECTYAPGTPYERDVFAAGYGLLTPMENDLADGDVWLLEDMPTGTACTVTEEDPAGAIGTTVEAENAVGTTGAVDGTTTDIALTENGPFGGTTNHVTFVNEFPVGSLALAKELTGDGAADRGAGPFTLNVECTSPAFGVDSWSGDVVLGGSEPLTATIDGILAPSLCTVTETDDGGADAVFFAPALPGARQSTVLVTPDAVEPVTVTVTNHFEELASLAVTKVVEDTIADQNGDVPDLGPYVVAVECIYDPGGPNEHEVYADGHGLLKPMVAFLDNGETVVYTGLPVTSVCTVTELVDGGAAATTITVSNADAAGAVVEGSTGEVVVTPNDDADSPTTGALVTNVYDPGFLVIDKVLSGPDVPGVVGPYTFSVECVLDRSPQPPVTVWSGEVVLGGGGPLAASVDNLVPGSECTVTETDSGGADAVVLTPAGAEDGTAVVTIEAGAEATVTVENIFDDSLAATGFDRWWAAWIALLLTGAGAAMVAGTTMRGPGRP